MEFRFVLADIKNSSITGYDLGHIEIEHDDKTISSANRIPSQAMMIFISIVSLLDGIRYLFINKSKSFKFIGAGSSFSINFIKIKKTVLCISIDSGFEFNISEADLVRGVYDACFEFYNIWGSRLSDSDAVKGDIEAALSEFKSLYDIKQKN